MTKHSSKAKTSKAHKWAEEKNLPSLQGDASSIKYAENVRKRLLETFFSLFNRSSLLNYKEYNDPVLVALVTEPWNPINWLAWADKLEEDSQWVCPYTNGNLDQLRAVPWLLAQDSAAYWGRYAYRCVVDLILERVRSQAVEVKRARTARFVTDRGGEE